MPLMKGKRSPIRSDAGKSKLGKVMREWAQGDLKSSSGHKVKSRKQAIAIGMSEARKRGY